MRNDPNTMAIMLAAQNYLSRQEYGQAINCLLKILETDPENKEASVLLEQVREITEYQHRDIFSATNLDMDPWLE
ncbi:hypothetical protein [Gaoshiqia sediminis]|uniref:Tetratricopeptide repeat protein n=1 Tax=Gaoshiqia sediminis TaxID=2986998 RepID=A0AA41YDT1_9BACT|nr:hypothetical protein [Gaoshiqia sediminis]MCW0484915.1 hypothetical protein [Gaoshiqia sediminis]